MSEISGILKNGIDRGWQLNEIRQSLLSAGYVSKEIESEMMAFQAKPFTTSEQEGKEKFDPQKLNNYQTPPIENKKSFSLLSFFMVFLFILLIAGIGLYFLFF